MAAFLLIIQTYIGDQVIKVLVEGFSTQFSLIESGIWSRRYSGASFGFAQGNFATRTRKYPPQVAWDEVEISTRHSLVQIWNSRLGRCEADLDEKEIDPGYDIELWS